MDSPWKALSDDNGRQILLSFKEKDITPPNPERRRSDNGKEASKNRYIHK